MLENNSNNVRLGGGSSVGGNFTGRDSYNNTSLVINNHTRHTSSYFENLYSKYLEEQDNNPLFKEFCEDLNYYYSPLANEPIIGLQSKLQAANRGDIFWYATDVKERYHKKLLKYSQYSEVAQEVNIHLLATIRAYFMSEIYPFIREGIDGTIIESLVVEKIINPVFLDLGHNLFKYTKDDIQGMIYFLTGNCHIKWNR